MAEVTEDDKYCGNCGGTYKFECENCIGHSEWIPRKSKLEEEPKVVDDVPGFIIKLELDDESCISVANAICNYCVNRMSDDETALIFMEELTEHIDSAVRAKKKWLEYQKSKGE